MRDLAEQAIFTSLAVAGRAGYHVVSRSPGVSAAEADELALWSPSHGGLAVDEANSCSVNFHPLRSSGRSVLSRSAAGPPEYSGRGGCQVYTHALILSPQTLERWQNGLIDLYRAVRALGMMRFHSDPPSSLPSPEIPWVSSRSEGRDWRREAARLGIAGPDDTVERLARGGSIQLHHAGRRLEVAEVLLRLCSVRLIPKLSFSTSLIPSISRPYRLCLMA